MSSSAGDKTEMREDGRRVVDRHPLCGRDPEFPLLHRRQREKLSERHQEFDLVEGVCQVELQTVERLPRLDLQFCKGCGRGERDRFRSTEVETGATGVHNQALLSRFLRNSEDTDVHTHDEVQERAHTIKQASYDAKIQPPVSANSRVQKKLCSATLFMRQGMSIVKVVVGVSAQVLTNY